MKPGPQNAKTSDISVKACVTFTNEQWQIKIIQHLKIAAVLQQHPEINKAKQLADVLRLEIL